MFNTLASYLLGTSSQQETGGVEERNVRLTSVVSEDDWVLVDRDSEGNSEVDSSSTESLDEYGTCLESRPLLPHIITRSSSTASLPCTTLEESWFVTPPPCFTSAGPVHMETSPLENLLIEHPSMSVYQHSHPLIAQRRNSVPVQSADDSDLSEDEIEEVSQAAPVQRVRQLEDAYREQERHDRQIQTPRVNVVNTLRKQEEQWLKNRQAQKVQLQKACQSLKRRYLERANKAREVNYRNRHQRRNERCQGATRSYANNNRKC